MKAHLFVTGFLDVIGQKPYLILKLFNLLPTLR